MVQSRVGLFFFLGRFIDAQYYRDVPGIEYVRETSFYNNKAAPNSPFYDSESYVNMAFSSSSSDSSEFNIDPIVEEEVVWRTEKVKNIAMVVKFEKLPMFTQIQWRCPKEAQYCDMSSFYDEKKTYANIFEDDSDGEYECFFFLNQDPVYVKRFILKSTEKFIALRKSTKTDGEENTVQLRGMAAVTSDVVTINTKYCEEFSKATRSRQEHSSRDAQESCCDSFSIRLDRFSRVSGTYSRLRKTVNNRPIWKNRAFALWASKEGNWMIGSVKSIGKNRGFLIAKNSINCPNKLSSIFDAKAQESIPIHTSCDCCEVLTVKGSTHQQNSKYGIYIRSSHLSSLPGEYRQIWPSSKHGNVIYNESGQYYISDRPRATVGHLGIFSDKTRGCPSDAKGWKSWVGFDKTIIDSEFKVSCFSGNSECIYAYNFCEAKEDAKLCLESIFHCKGLDASLCNEQREQLTSECFYGKCS
ncbi:Oidioi.mRNA.OKI2018_I69.chr2.g4382.t1.cds [Oikopleura dioica]|uniref:Oidioi.mRNA.OKI2018_I69.chr2.g4382.t1.cds n=1 Tax=Oikopleura dioica TaxID=34765 RepID=A0ABN7SX76_OIKDI|nr:Oidioi.mRNA.OKI2018_I69.chr2.g4382.t1.cds [Oikopleura dioica]